LQAGQQVQLLEQQLLLVVVLASVPLMQVHPLLPAVGVLAL
jgi:hypothetical protein